MGWYAIVYSAMDNERYTLYKELTYLQYKMIDHCADNILYYY